jgi:hypothetical protein
VAKRSESSFGREHEDVAHATSYSKCTTGGKITSITPSTGGQHEAQHLIAKTPNAGTPNPSRSAVSRQPRGGKHHHHMHRPAPGLARPPSESDSSLMSISLAASAHGGPPSHSMRRGEDTMTRGEGRCLSVERLARPPTRRPKAGPKKKGEMEENTACRGNCGTSDAARCCATFSTAGRDAAAPQAEVSGQDCDCATR